jgi:hypothetical protein
MTHMEFLTRMELKSLTQQSECAGAESGCLRMLSECLGSFSMRLGVPFIAPRQLGAVEDQQGRLSLPSVEWRTGQSSAPPDTVRGTPDSPVPPTDRWRGPRVARGLRGRPLRWRPLAHRTVRCTTGQFSEL